MGIRQRMVRVAICFARDRLAAKQVQAIGVGCDRKVTLTDVEFGEHDGFDLGDLCAITHAFVCAPPGATVKESPDFT